jgi:hypothetical protein
LPRARGWLRRAALGLPLTLPRALAAVSGNLTPGGRIGAEGGYMGVWLVNLARR